MVSYQYLLQRDRGSTREKQIREEVRIKAPAGEEMENRSTAICLQFSATLLAPNRG